MARPSINSPATLTAASRSSGRLISQAKVAIPSRPDYIGQIRICAGHFFEGSSETHVRLSDVGTGGFFRQVRFRPSISARQAAQVT